MQLPFGRTCGSYFFKNPKTVQGSARPFWPLHDHWRRNKYFGKKEDYQDFQMLKHPSLEAHQNSLL